MAETLLLLSGRAHATEPVLANEEVHELSLNPDGRLRVASKQGYFPTVSGTLITAAQTIPVDVTDASNLVLHIKNTGSAAMAAGAFVFEGSIDSTDGLDGAWFTVQGARSESNVIETGRTTSSLAAGSGQAYAWELSVNAIRWFRIRCSTTLTTSAIATWTIVRGSYATEPIPAVQTHAVTGSGNFTILPAAGTKFSLNGAASTNQTLVSTGVKNLFEIYVFNPTAAKIYFKLYDKATAPVAGTDIPLVVIPVEINTGVSINFGTLGKRFTLGLGYAITAGPLTTDNAAVAIGVLASGTYS